MAKKPRRILPRLGKPTQALREKRAESRHGSRIVIIETTSDDPERLDFVYTLGSFSGLSAYLRRASKGRTNPRHTISHWEQDNNHRDGGVLIERFVR